MYIMFQFLGSKALHLRFEMLNVLQEQESHNPQMARYEIFIVSTIEYSPFSTRFNQIWIKYLPIDLK